MTTVRDRIAMYSRRGSVPTTTESTVCHLPFGFRCKRHTPRGRPARESAWACPFPFLYLFGRATTSSRWTRGDAHHTSKNEEEMALKIRIIGSQIRDQTQRIYDTRGDVSALQKQQETMQRRMTVMTECALQQRADIIALRRQIDSVSDELWKPGGVGYKQVQQDFQHQQRGSSSKDDDTAEPDFIVPPVCPSKITSPPEGPVALDMCI